MTTGSALDEAPTWVDIDGRKGGNGERLPGVSRRDFSMGEGTSCPLCGFCLREGLQLGGGRLTFCSWAGGFGVLCAEGRSGGRLGELCGGAGVACGVLGTLETEHG